AHRRRARERLARADARLGRPRAPRRRRRGCPGHPRRTRPRRLGRLLRHRGLLRQRNVRHRVPGLALGCRCRRARRSWQEAIAGVLGGTEGGGISRARRGDGVRRIALIAVAAAALLLAATAAARTSAGKPIVIGWAFDAKGAMAPFDGPALAAAKIRVAQINAKGGVNGRPLSIQTCDTQNNKPAVSKACADKLIAGGASVLFTTCDVDYAAPAVQEGISHGLLTVAPCIGTDQMGPKRFGAAGKLAFSFGNVAQDE